MCPSLSLDYLCFSVVAMLCIVITRHSSTRAESALSFYNFKLDVNR